MIGADARNGVDATDTPPRQLWASCFWPLALMWPGFAGAASEGFPGVYCSRRNAETKASLGTSTRPMAFIRFLPSFCRSSSLRFRVMSPP